MRKQVIAGNWKMNLTWDEAQTLVVELIRMEKQLDFSNRETVLFPSAIYARQAVELIGQYKSKMVVGLQDCSNSQNGAFTGEVSAVQAASLGAKAVIIGHSERREYHNESGVQLLAKVGRALDANLTPFFCVGEHLADRKSGQHFDLISNQLNEVVFTLPQPAFHKVVLAYEPVWAIGTGETASPEQAQEMHRFIREQVAKVYGESTADMVRIIYGGSMNASNAKQLLSQPDVDGGLIGGASLKAETFAQIVMA